MSKKEKSWKAKEVDEIQTVYEKEETEDSSTQTIKIYWPKIALLGFFSSVVFTIINVILLLIFYFGLGTDILVIMYFM
ncbi:unnamed protein product, partial [marine sediment metagenome]